MHYVYVSAMEGDREGRFGDQTPILLWDTNTYILFQGAYKCLIQ